MGIDDKTKNNDEKLKALEAAISKIEKDFGKGAVMKLGESGANMNVETVPTGYRPGAWRNPEGTYHRGIRSGIQR